MIDNKTDLSLYKPNPSLTAVFLIDETMTDEDLTFDAFKKLVLARKSEDFIFLTIGKILKLFRDRKLYTKLDFETFSQFLSSEELSFSREKAYMYIGIWETFIEKLQLSEEKLGEIGVARLNMLRPVVKDMSREEAIKTVEDSANVRYGEFVRSVKEKTNINGKPAVYWSEQQGLWVINYWEDKVNLVSLGKFEGGDQ